MALEHAILVSLMEHSGSGFELARRFDRSIGYFWSATHQQIYRALRRMHEVGWVDVEVVAQTGRPDKKVYTPTTAGQAELRRWIAAPTEGANPLATLAVKLRGASYGDPLALRGEFQQHLTRSEKRLEEYRHIEKRDFPAPTTLTGAKLHQYLVLQAGMSAEEHMSTWCRSVVNALHTTA
jgi:DNA-binding PadR family transcriptional regulator